MATTKGVTAIWNAQSLTAGAGDTNSAKQTMTDAYAAAVHVKLTNGATGPTIPAQVQIELTGDAASEEWYEYGGPLVGGVANSGVYSWSIPIPPGALYLRLVAGSNTGQAVTVNADLVEITAV